MFTKHDFPLDQRVKIHGFPENDPLQGATGTILGKSAEHVVDFYIMMLDQPTLTHKAIQIIESCLSPI